MTFGVVDLRDLSDLRILEISGISDLRGLIRVRDLGDLRGLWTLGDLRDSYRSQCCIPAAVVRRRSQRSGRCDERKPSCPL